jgi:hypothetical protein
MPLEVGKSVLASAANVTSLLEVGVGINFALALLDGFKARLEAYAKFFSRVGLHKEEITEGLDALRIVEGDGPTIQQVALKAKGYDARIENLSTDVGFSDGVWDVLKLGAIIAGLFLFVNIGRFSFGGYVLDLWEVYILAFISAMPFIIMAVTIMRSSAKAISLKIGIKFFLYKNDSLIQSYKENKKRTIPPLISE